MAGQRADFQNDEMRMASVRIRDPFVRVSLA